MVWSRYICFADLPPCRCIIHLCAPSKITTVTVCAKPDMPAHKLKLLLLPQLIATLNNYACSLHQLANVN